MPTVPFRGLGTKGIVKDLPPADLPLEAYTGGNNVRFANGASMRSPSWRTSNPSLSFVPSGTFLYSPPGGSETTFIPADTGAIWSRSSANALTDVSVPGFTPATSSTQFTACSLGAVFYLNRESHVPRYFTSASSTFTALPAWNAAWRCEVLRSFKDFLVAFNVTKSATQFQTMVKWSDAALAGAPPASWDETDPTKLAGETILAELSGPIVDAQNLRDAVVIYGTNEVWLMEFVGGQFVFRFRRIFGDAGILNRNCAVEVEGRHYVFGNDDIYVHDGTQRKSLAAGRVRDFVFRNLNTAHLNRSFVAHNVATREILFCYVSGDADAVPGFTGGTGVNRAAVYCYDNDTWGFMDIPNVFGPMSLAPASAALTYATAPAGFDATGGSYQDVVGSVRRTPMASVRALGSSIASARLSFLDPIEANSTVPFALDTALFTPAYLEKEHIDLDAQGAELTVFKTVSRVVPQLRMVTGGNVAFRFGAANLHGAATTWADPLTFNAATDYKIDTRVSGRYLALRATVTEPRDFSLSGFDATITSNGAR